MTSAPLIPPRPSRAKENEATSSPAALVPTIPPRPSTKPRPKSPLPTGGSANENSSEESRAETEPALTTISPYTELHHPVATRVSCKEPEPIRKDTGIPQIGSRVPMYPNAGDVQAPTPSVTPGGGKKSHVYREEWEMDEGAYGSNGTPSVNPYTRSSSDLNQSVAQGLSAPETDTPVPDEEIGYLASEQYARVISPQDIGPLNLSGEDAAPTARVISDDAPVDDKDRDIAIHLDPPTHHHHSHNHHPHRAASSKPGTRPASPTKHYNDDEDDDENDGNDTETELEREHEYPILAEDEVLKRSGGEFMVPAVSPPLTVWRAGSTANSRPQSIHPGGLDDSEGDDVESVRLSGRGFESRESLTASSLESGERPEPLFPESDDEAEAETGTTALENKSHEKLKRPGIPESIGSSGGHKFPSKDVWEEAPEFSQLEATVSSTPAPADAEMTDEEKEADRMISRRTDGKPETEVAFIHGQPNEHYMPGDEVEFERKQKEALGNTAEYRHQVNREGRDDGLEKLLKRGASTDDPDKLGVNAGRAGVKRFPSNDIWEDAPPSLQLSAEVMELPEEEYTAIEPKERATTSATTTFEDPATTEVERCPITSTPIEASSKPELPTHPAVPPPQKAWNITPGTAPTPPERPQAFTSTEQPATEKKLPPGPPGRPKPNVPLNRPVRGAARSPSADVVVAPKPKPSVPPRTGGKIAALKAGFLNDLDNRLKLGPMAPKKAEEESPTSLEKEKEKEKDVLADVRKSRAKGPRGRKLPTATTTETAKEAPNEKKQELVNVGVWTIWSVGDEGDVEVLTDSPAEEKEKELEVAKEAPVATTGTLPSVSSTRVQAIPSVSTTTEARETENAPATTAAEEREERGYLATIVPPEEHPEDAVSAEVQEDVCEAEKVRTGVAAEIAATGGEVDNTEGDVRLEA